MDYPNVLVIMADQMKATASHLYGNSFCDTPHMARMAEEGVLFRHAVTPHPLCVPARVSLWTGQWPHSHGARRNETLMPPDARHAFKLWKQLGFHCGLIGKNHCFETPEDLALFDTWNEISHGGIRRGALHKGMPWFRPRAAIDHAHSVRRQMPDTSPRFSYAVSEFPLEDYSTGLVAGQTARFLEAHRDEPFALWVSFPDPHTPYEAPCRYAEMYPPEAIDLPPWREGEWNDAPERVRVLRYLLGMEDDPIQDVRGVVSVYHAMVRFLDDGLGQILNALDRLDLRRRTIVVFTADHGDCSGEHNMISKGGAFYDCLTRIPMVVSWPGGVPQGRIDESMANLVDVAPTLLQLQGIEIPRTMHGQPLPTVTDAAPREVTFSEYGAGGPPFTVADLLKLPPPYGRPAVMRSLRWREAEGRRKMARTREWKYVHDPMGDLDEFYDLVNDPWELYNVVGDRAHRGALDEMARKLGGWSIQTEDARPVPLPEESYYELS